MYGRVPVPSGNAARAQEIYETVTELLEMMYSPGMIRPVFARALLHRRGFAFPTRNAGFHRFAT